MKISCRAACNDVIPRTTVMAAQSTSSAGSASLARRFDFRHDFPEGQLVEPAFTLFRVVPRAGAVLVQETERIHHAHLPDQNLSPLRGDFRERANPFAHGATS